MPEFLFQEPVAGWFAKIASKLNGDVTPSAVTFGSLTIFLVVPDDRLRRHEAAHRAQARTFDPWWCPVRSWRETIGDARFLVAYVKEHRLAGYEANRFEVQARAAENV